MNSLQSPFSGEFQAAWNSGHDSRFRGVLQTDTAAGRAFSALAPGQQRFLMSYIRDAITEDEAEARIRAAMDSLGGEL